MSPQRLGGVAESENGKPFVQRPLAWGDQKENGRLSCLELPFLAAPTRKRDRDRERKRKRERKRERKRKTKRRTQSARRLSRRSRAEAMAWGLEAWLSKETK